MTTPLYHLPDDDVPISEWCRPISAALVSRKHEPRYGDAFMAARLAQLVMQRRKDAKYRARLKREGRRRNG